MTDVELVSAPQEDAQYSWWRRKDVKTIFLIWLLLTVIGLSLCWVPAHLMGESASEQMDETRACFYSSVLSSGQQLVV